MVSDKRRLGYAILSSLLVLLALFPVSTAAEMVSVRKVIDGDTVSLTDGRKVRLLGINSPERGEPYSKKATRMLETLTNRPSVRLEYDVEREDRYGRILAYLYAGEEMLNERLLREGLAHALFIGQNGKHAALLLRSQEEARKKRKGLWRIWGRWKNFKITSLRLGEDETEHYLRIVSLGPKRASLSGYVLTNEGGDRFVFPQISVDPGYSVLVRNSAAPPGGGVSSQGYLSLPKNFRFHQGGDTAVLLDPGGRTVDQFFQSGKRPPTGRRGGNR